MQNSQSLIACGGQARPAVGVPVRKESDLPPMSDTMSTTNADSLSDQERHGTFDAEGVYVPRKIVEDDLGDMSFEDAVDQTIVAFEDGDVVTGKVVKVDKDEVLLDIGFKSEGVIDRKSTRLNSSHLGIS